MSNLKSVTVGQFVWMDETRPSWQGRTETRLVDISSIDKNGRLYICAESLWGQWRYGFHPETGKARAYDGCTMRYATPGEVLEYHAQERKAETLKLEAEAAVIAENKIRDAAPTMLKALRAIEEALRKDSRQKDITGDEVEYHLDGQTLGWAITAARKAIAFAEGR